MAAQRRGAPPDPSPNPNPNSNPNPNPNPNPDPSPSPSASPNQVLYRALPPLEKASWQRLGNPTRNGHTFYSQPTAVLPYPYYPYYPATTPSYAHAHAHRPPRLTPSRLEAGGGDASSPRLQAAGPRLEAGGGDASSQSRLLLYLGDRWNMRGPGSVGDAG